MKSSSLRVVVVLLLLVGAGLGLVIWAEQTRSGVERDLLDRSFTAMEGTRAVQTLLNAMQLGTLDHQGGKELIDQMFGVADTPGESRALSAIRACFAPDAPSNLTCIEAAVTRAKTIYSEELSHVWARAADEQRTSRFVFIAGLVLVTVPALILAFLLIVVVRVNADRPSVDDGRELKTVLRKRLEDLYSVHAKPPDEKSNADRLQTVLGALAEAVAERAGSLSGADQTLLSELRDLGGTPESTRPSFLPARSLLDTVQDAYDHKVEVDVRTSAPPVVVADSAVTNVALLLLTKSLGRTGNMVSAKVDVIETSSGPMVRMSLRTEGQAPPEAQLAERIAKRLIEAQGGTLERRFNGADVCLRATRASVPAVDETFAGPWNR